MPKSWRKVHHKFQEYEKVRLRMEGVHALEKKYLDWLPKHTLLYGRKCLSDFPNHPWTCQACQKYHLHNASGCWRFEAEDNCGARRGPLFPKEWQRAKQMMTLYYENPLSFGYEPNFLNPDDVRRSFIEAYTNEDPVIDENEDPHNLVYMIQAL